MPARRRSGRGSSAASSTGRTARCARSRCTGSDRPVQRRQDRRERPTAGRREQNDGRGRRTPASARPLTPRRASTGLRRDPPAGFRRRGRSPTWTRTARPLPARGGPPWRTASSTPRRCRWPADGRDPAVGEWGRQAAPCCEERHEGHQQRDGEVEPGHDRAGASTGQTIPGDARTLHQQRARGDRGDHTGAPRPSRR
jgi:hypothetical protein